MAKVNKDNIKVGMTIWSAFDDRPFYGYGYSKGIVTLIEDNHYLFDDVENDIPHIWGDFDEEPGSVCNFTTKQEAINWLKKGEH